MFKAVLIIMLIYLGQINLSLADAKLEQAKKQQQEAIKTQNKLQTNLQQTKNEQTKEQQKLRQIEQQISNLQTNIRKINTSIEQTKKDLAKLEQERTQINQQLNAQQTIIAAQIKAAYKNAKFNEPLRLALNQQNISQVNRFLTYYQYLNKARQAQITNFAQNLQQLEANNAKIAANQNKQQQELAALNKEQQTLAGNKKEREKIIKNLTAQQKSTAQKIAANKAQQAQIANLITQIEAANKRRMLAQTSSKFGAERGKLKLPVSGKIMAKFGDKRPNADNWDAMLISAPSGSSVQAIYHGTVVYADWMQGLGYLLIISHGDGYLSLYGHNQSLLKAKGDLVNTGDVIARVGLSGGMSASALYFAIRYQGKAQNPALWCK